MVLSEAEGAARRVEALKPSPSVASLRTLVRCLAADASERTRRALADFKEEAALEAHHAAALAWLVQAQAADYSADYSADFSAAQTSAAIDAKQMDAKQMDSLLEALVGLVALCHRFLAFAQAPGGLGLDQHAASDLPIFVEALTLAAQCVSF